MSKWKSNKISAISALLITKEKRLNFPARTKLSNQFSMVRTKRLESLTGDSTAGGGWTSPIILIIRSWRRWYCKKQKHITKENWSFSLLMIMFRLLVNNLNNIKEKNKRRKILDLYDPIFFLYTSNLSVI